MTATRGAIVKRKMYRNDGESFCMQRLTILAIKSNFSLEDILALINLSACDASIRHSFSLGSVWIDENQDIATIVKKTKSI
jgi:hypothetical protein